MTNDEAEKIRSVAVQLLNISSSAILENQKQEKKKKEFFENAKESKVFSFVEYRKLFDKNKNDKE